MFVKNWSHKGSHDQGNPLPYVDILPVLNQHDNFGFNKQSLNLSSQGHHSAVLLPPVAGQTSSGQAAGGPGQAFRVGAEGGHTQGQGEGRSHP